MFHDREDAAHRLAAILRTWEIGNPLILAIPRGGVILGAILAQQLGGELDVVLSRKLHAPGQPELAIGAVSEAGHVHLNRHACEALDVTEEYVRREKDRQLIEVSRRRRLFRSVRPEATVRGRNVIVTDDGIATGSTMMAALETVRPQRPRRLYMAVPVAPRDRLSAFEERCDRVICLRTPAEFWAVGQFFESFPTVEDEDVVEILKNFAAHFAGNTANVCQDARKKSTLH
jgi:predicted phosphoribosyltransferase